MPHVPANVVICNIFQKMEVRTQRVRIVSLFTVLQASTVCPLYWQFEYKNHTGGFAQTPHGAPIMSTRPTSLPFKGVIL